MEVNRYYFLHKNLTIVESCLRQLVKSFNLIDIIEPKIREENRRDRH